MFGFASTMFSRNGTRTTTSRFMSGLTFFGQNTAPSVAVNALRRNISHETNLYLPELPVEAPIARVPSGNLLISASRSFESFSLDEFLDGITDELALYLTSFPEAKDASFNALFEALGLEDTEIVYEFCCPVSLDVTNRPVKVNGITLDYDSLVSLPIASDGTRKNPMTREDFYLAQVEPDYDRSQAIFNYITAQQAAVIATPFATP
jgi:hypothetical protein